MSKVKAFNDQLDTGECAKLLITGCPSLSNHPLSIAPQEWVGDCVVSPVHTGMLTSGLILSWLPQLF